jgi:phosphoheptose isomerase
MTSSDSVALVQEIFDKTVDVHGRFAQNGLPGVVAAADAIRRAVTTGGKVLAFGNGGSATDAEHLVSELVGRFEKERRGLAGIALTPGSAVVTAIANDYGYERVFTRQIEALGREGDVAFGISTSGRSPNVLEGLAAAKACGMTTIALTGRDGGPMGAQVDIHLNVAEASTARVQEVHRTIIHAVCALVERSITASSSA